MREKFYLSGESAPELEARIMDMRGDKTGLYLIGQGVQQPFWQDGWVWLANYSWEVDPRNCFLQEDFERYHRIQDVKWAIWDAMQRGYSLAECLSDCPDHYLAWNDNTPSHWLDLLANHENALIKQGVACNPNTPPQTLAQLVHVLNYDVQMSLSGNPNTPADTVLTLARDDDLPLHSAYHLPAHPNITIEALHVLAQHESLFVRRRALARLETMPKSSYQLALF